MAPLYHRLVPQGPCQGGGARGQYLDKFLPWLSLNLDIVGAVGLGSSIPQVGTPGSMPGGGARGQYLDKFLPWLSLNLDIVGAVGLGSSIPQVGTPGSMPGGWG